MTRAEKIIAIAKSYVGITEKSGNSGFTDANFERDLTGLGWSKGQPWCAYFAEMVWQLSYADLRQLLVTIAKLNSGHALGTYNAHKANGTFKVSQTPSLGAIVIWKHDKGPAGHAGIVVELVDDNTIRTIEGNTNAHGSREGDRVAEKLRTINRPFKAGGLNLVGFINPIEQ